MTRMTAPEPTPPSLPSRLRRFGQRALAGVLVGIFGLWVHELFSEPAAPKGWKLLLLLLLLLPAIAGVGALACAAIADRRAKRGG